MGRLTLIGLVGIICTQMLCGQSIADLMPVSKSVRKEASLPAEKQRKLDRIIQERGTKNMRFGQVANCNSTFLLQSFTQFVEHNDSTFLLNDAPYQNAYSYTLPAMRITNSSHGHELTTGSGGKFNIKKDRLSSVILDNRQQLFIVNHNDEICDPALFKFSAEGEALHMEGNRIVLDATPHQFALGLYPTKQQITVTHLSSKTTYNYDLQIRFEDSLSWRGQKKAIAVMAYPTEAFPQLGLMLNLTDKTLTFVQLPLTIHGEGANGRDGHRGYNGANGINTYTWTDKEGKKHTTAGTCGQAGGDGEDGTDGTDGGQYFILLDTALEAQMGLGCITAWIDAGIGGQGGKGGEGGIHGRGSGCYGTARNGANGRHGRNGQRGDFLYVIGDVQSWIKEGLK